MSEHLYQFSDNYFKDKGIGRKWAENQKELLLDSQVSKVIKKITKLAGDKNKAASDLIANYESNLDRMDYKRYQQIGCGIIGSGANESAHITVVQKRMKLSGQRWSKQGAKHMLNLRVTYMNEQWAKVVKLAKTNFKAAA